MLATPILSAQQQPSNPGTYTNPILDVRFPDPTVFRVGDVYYAYGTGDIEGDSSGRFMPMSMSRDLKHWSACLGVAVSDRPEGIFEPLDRPLDKDACAQGFGDIDPNVFVDDKPGGDGKRYLYWGSAHKPIRRQQISADLLSLAPGTKNDDVLRPTPQGPPVQYTDLVEGSWVLYREGRYYLSPPATIAARDDDGYAVVVWRRITPRARGRASPAAAAARSSTPTPNGAHPVTTAFSPTVRGRTGFSITRATRGGLASASC